MSDLWIKMSRLRSLEVVVQKNYPRFLVVCYQDQWRTKMNLSQDNQLKESLGREYFRGKVAQRLIVRTTEAPLNGKR